MTQTPSSPTNNKKTRLRNIGIIAAIIIVMAAAGIIIELLSQKSIHLIALRYMLIVVGLVCIGFFAGLIAIAVRYRRQQREKH